MSPEERAALVADLERLNAELSAATSARPRDNDVVFELQTAFHVGFMDRCAGPQIRKLYDSIRPHVQRYEWAYGTQSDAPYAPSIAEHRRIIAAVAAGDPRAARDEIERHWANGVGRTARLIARFSPGG
jgi:DNA-binding GntR family transcriptional regulator